MERRPPRSPTGRNAPPKSGLESGFRRRDKGNFQTRDGKEGFRAEEKPRGPRPDRGDRPAPRGDRGDRPAPRGERSERGNFSDKPKRSYGDKPDRGPREDRGGYSDRPKRSFDGPRDGAPRGDRPDRGGYDKPRSYGDKPDRGGYGDKPKRSYGDKPDRGPREDRGGYSDRPKRSFDDKPKRSYGDKPDRGGYGDKPKRSYGDRPARDNDRGGYGDRPKRSFGDRPERSGFADKPKRSFGGDRNREPRPEKYEDKPKRSSGPRIEVSVYGIHATVAAILNDQREIKAIYATEENVVDLAPALEEAEENGRILPEITIVEREALNRALPRDAVHQGVGLDTPPLEEIFLQDIIRKAEVKKKSVVVLLDQVTDPHNIGAVIRSACAFGADAIVVQSRNAPELSGLIAKTASGAAEFVPLVYETNLSRAIEALKEAGFFCLALDERGQDIAAAPHYEKTLLVMGAEGPGLRPLIKEHCDLLIKLPTSGPISSLNVSNATAIALYAITTKAK